MEIKSYEEVIGSFSDLIGVPKSLKSSVVASLQDNVNFDTIRHLIFGNNEGTPRDGGYGHGGCNSDAFAVFGFLAFLLAAANLFMQNQAGGRRKRSVDPSSNPFHSENTMMCSAPRSTSEWNQEVVLASYSLFRGFLNALDAENSTCSQFIICEASKEAAKLGWIGKSLAKVGSANAHSWLTNINQELHNGTEAAGITGSEQEDCQIIFPCNQSFTNYRKPKLFG